MESTGETSRFASIDIGSHTLRLLVADLSPEGVLTPVWVDRKITRLARGFDDGQTLQGDRMEESLHVLAEFAGVLARLGVHSVACGATGVIRRAENGAEFLETVQRATGIPAGILSESAEAYLSAKGVLSVLPERSRVVLSFDLGGSSTEFLLLDAAASDPLWSTSVFIGASTLTQRTLAGDPPPHASILRAIQTIREALAPALAEAKAARESAHLDHVPLQLVGTAGTVTTLAAMSLEMTHYEPFRVNGLTLTETWLDETIDRLAGLTLQERRGLPGLEAGREDIILGGALLVREVLRGHGRLTVTDGGLLEGLLLELIERAANWPRALASPLIWRLI